MSISITRGDNGLLYIGLPYIQDLVDKIKTVEGRTWVPNIKQWTVPDTRKAIQELAAVFAGEHILTEPSLLSFFDAQNTLNDADILETAKKELKIKGYSPKTCKTYLWHMRHFLEFCSTKPTGSNPDLREYLFQLMEKGNASHSFVSQAVSAVKFLYREVLKKPEIIAKLPRPKRERKLPDVLT